jgi:hypothetical protein
MSVVGGASSGAGDLLFSAGAVNRLASDPPASPGFIGLLICSASSQQVAAASVETCAIAASPAAATSAASPKEAPGVAPGCVRSSKAALPVACVSAYGLAPAPKCCVFTDISASVVRNYGSFHQITITAATAVPGTAAAADANDSEWASDSDRDADTDSISHAALPQQQQQPATAAADAPAGDQVSVSGLQQLADTLASEEPIKRLYDDGLCVALWRCAACDVPPQFTGTEEQVRRCATLTSYHRTAVSPTTCCALPAGRSLFSCCLCHVTKGPVC